MIGYLEGAYYAATTRIIVWSHFCGYTKPGRYLVTIGGGNTECIWECVMDDFGDLLPVGRHS